MAMGITPRHAYRAKRDIGLTLVEVMIIVGILAIMLGIALPNFTRTRTRGLVTKAKSELRALQTAVESYYMHTNYAYPSALSDLTTATPTIIKVLPDDPFASSGTAYGYVRGGTGSSIYVIYSVGPDGSGSASIASDAVTESGGASCIYVSNVGEDTEP